MKIVWKTYVIIATILVRVRIVMMHVKEKTMCKVKVHKPTRNRVIVGHTHTPCIEPTHTQYYIREGLDSIKINYPKPKGFITQTDQ